MSRISIPASKTISHKRLWYGSILWTWITIWILSNNILHFQSWKYTMISDCCSNQRPRWCEITIPKRRLKVNALFFKTRSSRQEGAFFTVLFFKDKAWLTAKNFAVYVKNIIWWRLWFCNAVSYTIENNHPISFLMLIYFFFYLCLIS